MDRTWLQVVALMAIALTATVARADERDNPLSDARLIEGLWEGSWGGGNAGGAVLQPVMAELYVQGNRIELAGFPQGNRLRGSFEVDAINRRLKIAPDRGDDQKQTEPIELGYELKEGQLRIGSGGQAVTLQKLTTVPDPLADAQVEVMQATGINDRGELLVTQYTALEAGEKKDTHYRQYDTALSTRRATILLVQAAELEEISLDRARELLQKPVPVAVAYRRDLRPPPRQIFALRTDTGAAAADSMPVRRTLVRILQPGTLVFVLSAKENVPAP